MLFLLGGIVVLGGFLLLVYLFVNADPVRLARNLKWTGIGIAVLAVLLLAVTESARLFAVLVPLAMLMPVLVRLRGLFDRLWPRSAGQASTVATDFLRMSLDHDTGTMTGTVLRGRYAGLRIEEMGQGELTDLLRECRAQDEESARLLEAYLDRLHPDWRDELASGGTGSTGGGTGAAPPSGSDMTLAEAYAILGLSPGASSQEIKEAHHRLMIKLHPDHGGSDYIATQINRARDLLLGARRK